LERGGIRKEYPGVLRDAHSNASACVKATVTINPDLPPSLKIGFLKGKPNGDQTYKAWIRFSNAADRVTGDPDVDFRSMAIKMFGVSGERLPGAG